MVLGGGVRRWLLLLHLFLVVLQIGKEHLGLKAITEVLQDLQYKVRGRGQGTPRGRGQGTPGEGPGDLLL